MRIARCLASRNAALGRALFIEQRIRIRIRIRIAVLLGPGEGEFRLLHLLFLFSSLLGRRCSTELTEGRCVLNNVAEDRHLHAGDHGLKARHITDAVSIIKMNTSFTAIVLG